MLKILEDNVLESDPDDLGLKSALDKISTQVRETPKAHSDPQDKAQKEGWEKWIRLRERLGKRYAECKLSTFELSEDVKDRDRQMKVIDALRSYAEQMPKRIGSGKGIVLFGPAGTGKDHLLAAMMQQACWLNFSVVWRNGMDLYAERRDAISAERLERDLIQDMAQPDVLSISDPIPPSGALTEGQMEFLFRIVDARYRQCKPIWVTANFAEGKEAESKIGKQVVDRLRDGALALQCNWPSFRKAGL
jgi:DNA replication protein DnaC